MNLNEDKVVVKVEFKKKGKLETFNLVALKDDKRTETVKKRRGSQKSKINVFLQLIDLVEPEVVFDIGANYGEFLWPIDHENIIAFEPQRKVFSCLKDTYKDFTNIKLVNAAVSNENTERYLHIPIWTGNASLIEKHVIHPISEKEKVKVVDISSYLTNCKKFVAKIDVEGEEDNILDAISKLENNFEEYAVMFENTHTEKFHVTKEKRKILSSLAKNNFVFGVTNRRWTASNSEKKDIEYSQDIVKMNDFKAKKVYNPNDKELEEISQTSHDIIIVKTEKWK